MSRKTWKTFGGREKECKQGCRGYGDSRVDSMGIPTGFSVGMGTEIQSPRQLGVREGREGIHPHWQYDTMI